MRSESGVGFSMFLFFSKINFVYLISHTIHHHHLHRGSARVLAKSSVLPIDRTLEAQQNVVTNYEAQIYLLLYSKEFLKLV